MSEGAARLPGPPVALSSLSDKNLRVSGGQVDYSMGPASGPEDPAGGQPAAAQWMTPMIGAENQHKIALCETQPATAEGLRSLIERADGLCCAWAAPHLPLAIQLARQCRVDVLLLDKHFGQNLVLRAIQDLSRDCPETAVVVWGAALAEAEALRFLQAGARGLLRKTASLATIEQCLRTAARGGVWVDDNVVAAAPERQERGLSQLTPRENQVLELVSQGLRNREIAAALGIRPGTVKIHLKHIFEKTGIHGRYSLALNLMTRRENRAARRAEVA